MYIRKVYVDYETKVLTIVSQEVVPGFGPIPAGEETFRSAKEYYQYPHLADLSEDDHSTADWFWHDMEEK